MHTRDQTIFPPASLGLVMLICIEEKQNGCATINFYSRKNHSFTSVANTKIFTMDLYWSVTQLLALTAGKIHVTCLFLHVCLWLAVLMKWKYICCFSASLTVTIPFVEMVLAQHVVIFFPHVPSGVDLNAASPSGGLHFNRASTCTTLGITRSSK